MDFLKKLGIPLIALVFTFTLGMFAIGCGGGRSAPGTNTISGQGAKGPFVKGADVTAYQLNSDGTRTGKKVTAKTTDDLGTYSLTVPWSGPTEVEIVGNYLDELTGTATTTPQTLSAVEELPPLKAGVENKVTANPNIVTTVAAKLAKSSLKKGVSVKTAVESSKSSALSFLGLPTTDKKTGKKIDPSKLDLTKTADADFGDTNAKLLAVSAALSDAFKSTTKSATVKNVETLLESFATDIEKGNKLGTAADASGATGAGGAKIGAQITASITTVTNKIATVIASVNKVITDTKGADAVDTKLTATLTTAVTDVKKEVKTTLKGFTLSGNTLSEASGQTWTIKSDGTTTVTGASAIGTAVVISGTIKDRTGDGKVSAGASSNAATFSFYIKSSTDSRKIKGSLSPVNIDVASTGVVTVSVPASSVLTFSGTTTKGTTVAGTATNVSKDAIFTSSATGVFTINASNLLGVITNKVNQADLNILQTAGTFTFEFGFSGIEIGHETGGTTLDTLFPATSANVGGRVISGTIVTK